MCRNLGQSIAGVFIHDGVTHSGHTASVGRVQFFSYSSAAAGSMLSHAALGCTRVPCLHASQRGHKRGLAGDNCASCTVHLCAMREVPRLQWGTSARTLVHHHLAHPLSHARVLCPALPCARTHDVHSPIVHQLFVLVSRVDRFVPCRRSKQTPHVSRRCKRGVLAWNGLHAHCTRCAHCC